MKLGRCGCGQSDQDQQINLFFTQTESSQSIPFGDGTETTVLTLPVIVSGNLRIVQLNGLVQVLSVIPLGLVSYQYGVRLRIRRDGNLLFTQTLQQGNSITLTLSFNQIDSFPISFVDSNPTLGTNTYTVSLEFFLRSSTGVTITAQSRSLNGIIL